MWALVAVVIVGGIALYEYVTQPAGLAAGLAAAAEKARADADAATKSAARQGELAAKVQGLLAPPPVAADRAKMCGLLATDYHAADLWTAKTLGSALPVPERLKLMLSVTPYAAWPPEARRVYCAYVQELAPTHFPGGPGQHGGW